MVEVIRKIKTALLVFMHLCCFYLHFVSVCKSLFVHVMQYMTCTERHVKGSVILVDQFDPELKISGLIDICNLQPILTVEEYRKLKKS